MDEKKKAEASLELGFDVDAPLQELIDNKNILLYHNAIGFSPKLYGTAKAVLVSAMLADQLFKQADIIAQEPKMDSQLKENVQNYVNCFRSAACSVMQTNAGQTFDIVPFDDGVLLRILQKPGLTNSDNFLPKVSSLKDAFDSVAKNIIEILPANKISETSITKTGIYLSDYIYIVKGIDDEFWKEESAINEVNSINSHALKILKK
ncbi:hypothetical protein [Flavobacterium aquatile]|uniref:Uncharacterized protein n=1 Tax=Flavobacterium aquatile LMG 4008 = ATCC 11947 TaxID=1453498 RepID=A0A095SZ24_9FLAO|nr:hypothetical protein [Flavobacterium aquatile]KGD69594.1 hypothetical protein LG45_02205 [Flavobacterium aquatile LMG 4008 = ATCC 11947]OXA67270.1 hypothetical protein B0A61_08675 [Flavobacterium aquatile LMG 4008 = ATCC 11947]GEC77929.1 hypothetical protein FAQ01_07990 [Flavobacterium aquatile]